MSFNCLKLELSTENGFHWTFSCIDDPNQADIIPIGSSFTASVPGTLLDDLKDLLPDPFLYDNNIHPIFSKIERASFSYELNFDIASASSNSALDDVDVILSFEGLDTYAEVFLNGKSLLKTENAFHVHNILLEKGLIRERCNNMRIDFSTIHSAIEKRKSHKYREWNDPVGGISRVRTPQYVAGWDWGARMLGCGIVNPIKLFIIPLAKIADVACVQSFPKYNTDGSPACVDLTVSASINVTKNDKISSEEISQLYFESRLILENENGALRQISNILMSRVDGSEVMNMWNGDISNNNFKTLYFRCIFQLDRPILWWPNNMGKQSIYKVVTSLMMKFGGTVHEIDSKECTIGIRKLELIREPTHGLSMHSICKSEVEKEKKHNSPKVLKEDDLGESFVFCVNGRKFFSKGANYIPPQILYAKTSSKIYEEILQSTRQANMNMIRVWGGGIYENEKFYDICNRMGILLWHDFMFSCSLYPGDDSFIISCQREAKYQVARLRNNPCMALWCGNNELEQVPQDILSSNETKESYERLFYKVLKDVVNNDPGNVPYWPCSPHNPSGYEKGFNNPRAGDTHFWDVWHARKPISSYLGHISRFCSEFGMQSYISENGARRFAGYRKGALNPYGPILEAHQKNASGNMIIIDYCQRMFRMPKSDYGSLSYQSQLNQMICMQVGVEHFRRSWPYCSGALYWQLNDCWPCFSWSSIEYGGNWKALHFAARKFFNPLLLSIVHHGGEEVGVCNLRKYADETGIFTIHAVFDGQNNIVPLTFRWSLINITSGEVRFSSFKKLKMERDTTEEISVLNFREQSIDPKSHLLRAELISDCGRWSSKSVGWFCSPKLYDLRTPKITKKIKDYEITDGHTIGKVVIESDVFAAWCQVNFIESYEDSQTETESSKYKLPYRTKLSDNFFHSFPTESVTVSFEVGIVECLSNIEKRLQVLTLVDSYAT